MASYRIDRSYVHPLLVIISDVFIMEVLLVENHSFDTRI